MIAPACAEMWWTVKDRLQVILPHATHPTNFPNKLIVFASVKRIKMTSLAHVFG
jgi:hypothetical protein